MLYARRSAEKCAEKPGNSGIIPFAGWFISCRDAGGKGWSAERFQAHDKQIKGERVWKTKRKDCIWQERDQCSSLVIICSLLSVGSRIKLLFTLPLPEPSVLSPKIQLTIKQRVETFIQVKLKVITQKTGFQHLWELLHLLEVEGTVTYIFETNDRTSRWHTDILRKLHSCHRVQISACTRQATSP